jgi:hypothetical protein
MQKCEAKTLAVIGLREVIVSLEVGLRYVILSLLRREMKHNFKDMGLYCP